ncbi:hypothetical protein H0X09_01370 [Candidatus Saccharibacteria bacterium]|nr:hypothetical protein [Candidatus Saccharibacteria bacterium]
MRTTHKNFGIEKSIRIEATQANLHDLEVIKSMVRYRQRLLPKHSRRQLLEVSIDVLKEAIRLEQSHRKHGHFNTVHEDSCDEIL